MSSLSSSQLVRVLGVFGVMAFSTVMGGCAAGETGEDIVTVEEERLTAPGRATDRAYDDDADEGEGEKIGAAVGSTMGALRQEAAAQVVVAR